MQRIEPGQSEREVGTVFGLWVHESPGSGTVLQRRPTVKRQVERGATRAVQSDNVGPNHAEVPTVRKGFLATSIPWLGLLAWAALLAGCGTGFREFVNPPGASVQQLRAGDDGPWQVTLRVQNFSNVRTEVSRMDLVLFVGAARAGSLALDKVLEVEADSVEIVQLALKPDAQARAVLASDNTQTAGVAYRLEGRIETREPRGDYPLSHESRLAPVPGRAGEFR